MARVANNELVDMLLMYTVNVIRSQEASRNNNLTPGPDYTIFKCRSGYNAPFKKDIQLWTHKLVTTSEIFRKKQSLLEVILQTVASRIQAI
ncbi:hypothetical protein NQ317_010571 [Molorchus minor]|uniref:Uncharacterized protein n=1 Tax=Molorchus minor TaxID=1323400 RepID=A0ABQ9IRI7_9CUCU|nr:hypothetical protein NQ317_010571 [Molorchus minor]